MKFSDLGLSEHLLHAVSAAGYTVATPIQAQAIPHVLAGRDLLGCAQTGTGKTAAFALPIMHRMSVKPPSGNRVRCLVLCPTRELATQIAGDFRTYGGKLQFRIATVFGGVSQHHQVQALKRGVDILVATPGRLMDLMEQGYCDLRGVETLVLDEADRMLDMGFIQPIRKIVSVLPAQRQTLFFSATMPGEIRRLADAMLRNPASVQIAPTVSTAESIEESVYFVERANKPALLAHLVGHLPMSRAIVFTRTKHGADRVVRQLHGFGIRSEAIHGNKSQNQRQRALDNFKASKTPVLVATDIASRGIDIDDVSHVVNYDLTHEPETYVHRIGRTARAGASGAAVSFCDQEERQNLKGIERLIRRSIPVRTDHPVYKAGTGPAEVYRAHETRPHGAPAQGTQSHRTQSHGTQSHAATPHGQQSRAPRVQTHGSQGHGPQAHGGQANGGQPHGGQPHGKTPHRKGSHGPRAQVAQSPKGRQFTGHPRFSEGGAASHPLHRSRRSRG